MRHDPGLAASPPPCYRLKVERTGASPFLLVAARLSSRQRVGPRILQPSGAVRCTPGFSCARDRASDPGACRAGPVHHRGPESVLSGIWPVFGDDNVHRAVPAGPAIALTFLTGARIHHAP